MDLKEKDKWRCTWNGEISSFPDYVRRVRLVFAKTRKRHRKHLGPELVSQLTGRAWVVTQEIDHGRLVKDDGARYLVEYLEERLARVPVPDAGSKAEELLVKLRRPSGMSMAAWCQTVREHYRQLQKALKRAQPLGSPASHEGAPKEDLAGPKSGASSPSLSAGSRKDSKNTVPEPEGDGVDDVADDEQEDEHEESPPLRRGKRFWGSKYKGSKSSSSDDDDVQWGIRLWDDLDTSLPEVLPTELLGWLMLRRSDLSPQQRLNVLSAVGNRLRADDVERGLRGAEDELRLHEKEWEPRGKGKGGQFRPRPNFWVEQDGEWGLLALDDGQDQEWLEDGTVHWVGKDPTTVYPAPSDELFEIEKESGFWFQEDDGSYNFWSQASDGEYYRQDPQGAYWAWSSREEDQAWDAALWNASPEQVKEVQEAFAAYEAAQSKIRSFQKSRALIKHKNLSRGFYPRKGGKGKSKSGSSGGFGKGKGKPASSPAPAFHSEHGETFAAVGSPGYSGCFICGSKEHDFRHCPQRSRSSGGSKGSGKVFMVNEVDEQPIPRILASSMVEPEALGFGVLDTGATESVGSLEALEFICRRRTEILGHGNHRS